MFSYYRSPFQEKSDGNRVFIELFHYLDYPSLYKKDGKRNFMQMFKNCPRKNNLACVMHSIG